MPQNALAQVAVDYCASIEDMPELLVKLTQEPLAPEPARNIDMRENKKTELEIEIAKEASALESGVMNLGELSPFTCPECHGAFLKFRDGQIVRFRCHTGHAYSADALLATITEETEDAMWNAIRAVEEGIMLLTEISGNLAQAEKHELAARYRRKADEAEQRARILRRAVFQNESLSQENLQQPQSETPPEMQ